MKILVFLLLASISCSSMAQTIRPVNVNFGGISSASTREVILVNTTAKVMVISGIKADCNCTSVQFSKKPILVGDSTLIKVTYRPKSGESGLFYKVLRVEYATQKTPTEFTLRGVVKQ